MAPQCKTYYRALLAEPAWPQVKGPVGLNREPQSKLANLGPAPSWRTAKPRRLCGCTKCAGEADTHMQETETEPFHNGRISAHDGSKTKCGIWTGTMHGDTSVRAVEHHRYRKKLWLYMIIEAKGSEPKTDRQVHWGSIQHTEQQRKRQSTELENCLPMKDSYPYHIVYW